MNITKDWFEPHGGIQFFQNPSFMTFQTHTEMKNVIHTCNRFITIICFLICQIFTAERILGNLYSLSIFHLRNFTLFASITLFSYYMKISFHVFFSYLWLCHSFNEGKNNKGYWQDIMGSANYFLQVTSFNRLALVEKIICIFCPI